MSNDPNSDIGNYDPERYARDPTYRKLVDDAKSIKNNADELLRSGYKDPSVNQTETVPVTNTGNQATIVEQVETKFRGTNFTMKDFTDVQKFDQNSNVAKIRNEQGSKPINSVWMSKGDMMKYFATKNQFKIKELGSERHKTFEFQAIGEEQLTILTQMAEDLNKFYDLVLYENETEIDTFSGKEKRILKRNGISYHNRAELFLAYRREIAFMCLGVEYDEFKGLEMFSDPNYTVHDIWGINDILDGILQRAITGTSYFLIASKL